MRPRPGEPKMMDDNMDERFLNIFPGFSGLENPSEHNAPIHGFSYGGMMNTMGCPPALQTTFDGTPLPPISRPLAHDDMCVDNCTSVGVYHGADNFNHRGAPTSGLYRHNSVAVDGISRPWTGLDIQDLPIQSSWQQDLDLCRGTAQARSNVGIMRSISWQRNQGAPYPTPTDNDESTCCSSECSRPNKCSDTACENKPDACTDRNCPDNADILITDVATTLMSLKPNPEQAYFNVSSPMDTSMGFSMDNVFNLSTWPNPQMQCLPNLHDLSNHIQQAHRSSSSNCGQQCPLERAGVYSRCLFPATDLGASGLYDNFGNAEPFSQNAPNHPICGAGFSSGPEFFQHFWNYHCPKQYDFTTHPPTSGSISVSSSPFTVPKETPLSPSTLECDNGIKQSSPATPLSSLDSGSSETTAPRHDSAIDVSTPPDSSDPTTTNAGVCLWCDPATNQRCGAQFSGSKDLYDHVLVEHIQQLEKTDHGYLCCWHGCKRSDTENPGFSQRSKIERHMQTHVSWKPFECDVCGQGFSAKQALQQHKLIHSNEKPLKCTICGKDFRHQSALTMHLRVHSGDKPLQCHICGKKFSESSNLSKHKRTHEDKGRFPCLEPGCGRHFHRQDQLRRHQKQHEPRDGTLAKAGKAKSKTRNPSKRAAADLGAPSLGESHVPGESFLNIKSEYPDLGAEVSL